MRIFYIDWQQHWKYYRTMNIGANAHGKRAVSTLKTATSDRLDLRWQLGLQWHRIGIELVLQVPKLFHNATVSQCNHFLLLHMYMYLLFETSPGWRGIFLTQFGGATQLQCTVGTPYNTNVGVQKIPDRAIWKPVVAKRNNTNPWSCSKPQILVTRDSRQVHMAEQPASRDRLGVNFSLHAFITDCLTTL